jgi:nucleoside-diphosphate-sugar epimerase
MFADALLLLFELADREDERFQVAAARWHARFVLEAELPLRDAEGMMTLLCRLRGADRIVVWGDGSPTREFLYVEDAAEGLVLAAERYDSSEPVNLGSAFEVSIRDLVTLVAEATDFRGEIVWDTTQPNGQPRRCLDVSRAEREFGFVARTTFAEGLKRTVEWYRSTRAREVRG